MRALTSSEQAAARQAPNDIADDGIYFLALHKITVFLNLGRGTTGFVDDHGFGLETAKSLLVIRGWDFSGI